MMRLAKRDGEPGHLALVAVVASRRRAAALSRATAAAIQAAAACERWVLAGRARLDGKRAHGWTASR